MAWYWIVLIVVGYLIIGSVLAGLITWIPDFDDEDIFPVMVLLWPIALPFILLDLMCRAIINHFRS